jgi:esterase/lipase superfamily enzyme
MIIRVFVLLFLTVGIQAQNNYQYNIVLDKDSVIYEIKLLDDKLREKELFHYTELDTFVSYLCKDLGMQWEGKQEILFYVHGMWGSQSAMFRKSFTLMHELFLEDPDSDIARFVSLKWPSNEVEYNKNKQTVIDIAPQMAEVFKSFLISYQNYSTLLNGRKVHLDLLAHSMGNELIKEMLKYLDTSDLELPVIKQMIWAAADLDGDAFETDSLMLKYNQFAQRNHIYYNYRDLPLEVSKQLNKTDRLGLVGSLDSIEYPRNTYFVDVSFIRDDTNIPDLVSGHNYHRSSPQIIKDMLYVLMDCMATEISQRKPTDHEKVFRLRSTSLN